MLGSRATGAPGDCTAPIFVVAVLVMNGVATAALDNLPAFLEGKATVGAATSCHLYRSRPRHQAGARRRRYRVGGSIERCTAGSAESLIGRRLGAAAGAEVGHGVTWPVGGLIA